MPGITDHYDGLHYDGEQTFDAPASNLAQTLMWVCVNSKYLQPLLE